MCWNTEEAEFLKSLDHVIKIQDFLDLVEYNPKYECRSPRYVIKTRSAHCFEGALFAASALSFMGHK
ncbi:MAG: hypothetical protein ACM3UT_10385, partial [Chloroflexota bacterium]